MEQKDYGLSVWVSMSSTLPLLKVSLQPHFRFKLQPRSLLSCLLISCLVGSSSRPLITSCHPSKSFKGSHYFHGMESSACLSKLSTAFLSISSGPLFPLPRRPSLIRLHQPLLTRPSQTTLSAPLLLYPRPRTCPLMALASVQTSPHVQGHLKSCFPRDPSPLHTLKGLPSLSPHQHP